MKFDNGRDFVPTDSNGRSYQFPRASDVTTKEYAKVCHEINALYHTIYMDQPMGYIVTYSNEPDRPAYVYLFENHGFGEYNIYYKREDKH